MNLKTYLFDDDRGVSPVIGVILMVAITVILAAVIATFVMNMGPPKDQAPKANFDFKKVNSNTVKVTHTGGEAVPEAEITVKASGNTKQGSDFTGTGEISAGESVTISASSSDTVKVIWNSAQTDKSDVLASWTVPS